MLRSVWYGALRLVVMFFFNDPATSEIYTYLHTLSLHDALPIWPLRVTLSVTMTIRCTRRTSTEPRGPASPEVARTASSTRNRPPGGTRWPPSWLDSSPSWSRRVTPPLHQADNPRSVPVQARNACSDGHRSCRAVTTSGRG